MTNKIVCDAEDLTAIADAVRASNGSTNTYNVPELSAAAVNAIGTGGAGVSIDDTLTVSGAAADAKVTGERFTALSEEIAELKGGDVTEDVIYTGKIVSIDTEGGTPISVSLVAGEDETHSVGLIHCGKNLLNLDGFVCGKTNVAYKDGWIVLPHETAQQSQYNYDIYWRQESNYFLKPSTKYKIAIEFDSMSEASSGVVIFPATINSEHECLNHVGTISASAETISGKKFVAVTQTKDDISSCLYSIFARIKVPAGDTCSLKFRIAIIEAVDDYIKTISAVDAFEFPVYTGKTEQITLQDAVTSMEYGFGNVVSYDGVNTICVNKGYVVAKVTVTHPGNGGGMQTKTHVVSQHDVVIKTQKQVIETLVTQVDTARNAANYNVLPENAGNVNTKNLQSLLDAGGTIYVDIPGTYSFSGTLFIGSDTELVFGKQVVCSMDTAAAGGFLLNKGALTKTYDSNITVKGLHLLTNGATHSSNHYVPGLRGLVAFYYVKSLQLIDWHCDDFGTQAYFLHLSNWENVLIDNLYCVGGKDGIHMSRGRGMTIRHCTFDTKDDPIALNAYDYTSGCPEVGTIEDVLVEDCVDTRLCDLASGSRFAHVISGSWLDWANGNAYKNGHACVASNGCVYRLANPGSDEAHVSTIEPTHTAGTVTYDDGCIWMFTQTDGIYAAFCRNITFRNIVIAETRTQLFNFIFEDSTSCHSYYPGSNLIPHQNITIDNVRTANGFAAGRLLHLRAPVDLIRIANCDLEITAVYANVEAKDYDVIGNNDLTKIIMVGNYFRFGDNVKTFGFAYDRDLRRRFVVTATGNLKNRDDVNIVFNDNITFKLNDLN